MTQAVAQTDSVLFRSPSWTAQAGKVAQSIGTPFFHEELIRLLEATVATDAVWIIRYAGDAIPDVVFTRNVPAHTRRVYAEQCAKLDPFSAGWRKRRQAGVFTLDRLRSKDPAYRLYSDLFLAAAGMEDELGILLPVTAHNCFAIFLERKSGLFQEWEVERLDTVYPAIEPWCRSHLGWLFDDLKTPSRSGGMRLLNRPTIILDHAGQQIYANDSWNEAARRIPALKAQAAALAASAGAERDLGEVIIRAERLGPYFPLAPNGSMLVLEKATDPSSSPEADVATRLLSAFTRRERDILRLAVSGLGNQEISDAIGVASASIRNVKTRIYRKSGVTSEGELVLKFLPFAKQL